MESNMKTDTEDPTLAERDRRIAELELRIKNQASVIEYERGVLARPAPAPGELERDLSVVRGWMLGDTMPQSSVEALDAVVRAAESWQRLQWRPASEAPRGESSVELAYRLLSELDQLAQWPNNPGKQAARRAQMLEALSEGRTPDALPALNGGDDNG